MNILLALQLTTLVAPSRPVLGEKNLRLPTTTAAGLSLLVRPLCNDWHVGTWSMVAWSLTLHRAAGELQHNLTAKLESLNLPASQEPESRAADLAVQRLSFRGRGRAIKALKQHLEAA